MNYPVGPCTSSRTVFGLPAVFHLFSTQALSTTPLLKSPIREKRLSPRRGSRQPLLPLSPKRTQVRLKSLLYLVWLTPDSLRTHGRPSAKSTVCGLNGLRPTLRVGSLHLKSSTAFRALAPAASFRGSLCFASLSAENMAHHIFQRESGLQTIPKASPSFSVSEKLARYGSSALSGVEHLTLLV